MTTNHQSHIRRELITNGVSNTLFNALAAWLMLRGGAELDLYRNVIGDLIATAIILTFIVSLIVIPLNRSKVRKGAIQPLPPVDYGLQGLFQKLPVKAWQAGLVFAVAAAIVIAVPTVLVMVALNVGPFTPAEYSIIKGVWAGALAAIIAYPMILFGLATAYPAAVDSEAD